ncbi:uncharacterized protein VP01_264g8 [Puccinia sorghi]|uniref:Retrotransposon gag domain-containing protein n=1 Tax=Puccinia sorghi TaxID=27349 RepID=A0A0L6V464_9BASI|nr:uncharacterized protein VP01_264g8 [Puccinia sorghi]
MCPTATERTLRQTQAHLDTTAGQQNPTPAQPNPAPAPTSNPMVISKPQPFDGTSAEAFIGQIGLHAVTNPKRFPTNTSKVVSSFFDHNHQHCAEVALRNLRQTGTFLAYTQEFNQHTRTMGWANSLFMSLYQHNLK